MKVILKGTDIIFKNILVGDIWLCSGQSNMDFPLKRSETGKEELQNLDTTFSLRLFKLNSLRETDNTAWDSVILIKTNQLQFFSGNWKVCDKNSAEDFSAIAYYFGKKIKHEESVP